MNVIMEAMLILTLQTANSPRLGMTTQMFPTMEACHRTKQRLDILYDRTRTNWLATVVCVDAR